MTIQAQFGSRGSFRGAAADSRPHIPELVGRGDGEGGERPGGQQSTLERTRERRCAPTIDRATDRGAEQRTERAPEIHAVKRDLDGRAAWRSDLRDAQRAPDGIVERERDSRPSGKERADRAEEQRERGTRDATARLVLGLGLGLDQGADPTARMEAV